MSKFSVGDRVYFTPVEYGLKGRRVKATVVQVGDGRYDYLVEVDGYDTPDFLKKLMAVSGMDSEAAYEHELESIPDEEANEIAQLEALYDQT